MANFPKLAACSWLESLGVSLLGVFVAERSIRLVIVALDSRREAYHVANDTRLGIRLCEVRVNASPGQVLGQLQAVGVAEGVEAG